MVLFSAFVLHTYYIKWNSQTRKPITNHIETKDKLLYRAER